MKKIFILFFFVSPLFLYSQVSDNFEDGNLTGWSEDTPVRWSASADNPLNGSFSMHHIFNNADADHDQISIPFGSFDINGETTTWRFRVMHSYTPSGYNNWACFLFADKNADYMHPDSIVYGYAIGVNYTGSDDIIKLWKITGTVKTEIVNTGINWETEIGTSSVAGFEIKRTNSGEWSVFIDNTGGFDNLTQIGSSVVDTDHTNPSFLGFHYEYSSAQDMKLWFDDVYMGSEIADTDPPVIISLEAVANNTLIINFNEAVSESSSENVSHYTADGGLGNPQSATRSESDNKQVRLVFTQNFTDGQNNEITINGVQDLDGNPTIDEIGTFSYLHIAADNTMVISSNQLDVFYNKTIETVSASVLSNYTVDNGIGNPVSVVVDGSDNSLVHLSFSGDFILEEDYIITIDNVHDPYGNTILSTELDFVYYIVQPFDIVVNEIMCDINPPPNPYLPSSKYVEIYNRSEFDVNLSGWTIQIGDNSEKAFPDFVLSAGNFSIICDDTDQTSFSSFGSTIPILNPSELTTTGKRILIRDKNDAIIEDLSYTKDWYDDEDKDGGGWSLERIDPNNFCGENDNWTAYENDQLNYGGTPGSKNSVDGINIDNDYPEYLDLKVISSNYLILQFNENISYESGSNTLNFSINKGINNPSISYTNIDDRKEIHLKFSMQFQDNQDYTLIFEGVKDNCDNITPITGIEFRYNRINPEEIWLINGKNIKVKFSETVDFTTGTDENNYICNNDVGKPSLAVRESVDTTIIYLKFENSFPDGTESVLSMSNIEDINGNKIASTDLSFIYYLPKESDVVINEVLFNPYPNGVDFIELYNNSDYGIDISDLQLATKDDDNLNSLLSISQLSEANLIMNPKEYIAFTTSKEDVQLFYMSLNEQNIFEIESMPSFSDDSGKVVVLYKSEAILDEFDYNDAMHLRILKDTEGVSLERVNPGKKTQDITNWHSASEMVGFATPAYENSQYNEGRETSDDPVYVDPYIFSPDNDGFDDYANIHYQFGNPGYIATVYIFDFKGRIVRQLANNMILSVEGTLVWDGLYADYRIAPAGTYLIWFRINDLSGNVILFKKTVVLAKKY